MTKAAMPQSEEAMRRHLMAEPPGGHGMDSADMPMATMRSRHNAMHERGAGHEHGSMMSAEPSSLKYVTGPITKADAGGFEATISTPRVDKDGESVDPMGLTNRDEYLTNPLVYWSHEWAFDPSAEPIGKATRLDVSKSGIDSAAVFAPTAKAQNVRALVLGGFVRKTSIGFDPIRMESIKGVPTHVEWALREWSVVPMPANTDATITGVKSALRWFADQIADEAVETDLDRIDVTLSAAAVEAIVKATIADHLILTTDIDEGRTSLLEKSGRRLLVIRRRRTATLKAAWSSSYITALPDSAFACVDSAGRHYPHHNAEGSLDMPHLRAAMSRIGDPSNTQCGKGHLMAHARSSGMGDR